ncbi:DDB1- and CUL4-associated factor 5-like isoform X2 [Macrobrachium rosenbergii]|uniref:DDB1- and CUL4-associated factor 5-like isoform X2 n=1 Tax=Macrobrachium rosenbergii TaxID=79674 RepID=UPI0034D585C1
MRTGRLGELSSCFVNYLAQRTCHSARPDWSPGISSSVFLSRRLDSSRDLYHKDLYAHYGCVNAIEFSAEGDLLVSGGDDRRVLLWNIDGVLSENRQPHAMKGEHNSNIFCLSFDSCNSKIFSAGNDEQVIVHDLKTGDLVDVFLHREAVYGVSVNPTLDSVFASAGEDGQVLMYDMRESPASDPVCLARYHDAFHSVQFHPLEPTFIVTGNSREGVALWDVRKPKIPVLRYGEKQCAQSSMCAKFNRMGTQIVALRRRLPPILYDTQYSKPVCEFDAEHYYNSCTMKSCCFAGDRDQFILSGSDDFNLYMWKIPENKSYFVSEAHMVLKGHRSIVNQVRFNPQNFIIASSGVEKIVKLWSGVSLPGSKGSLQTKSCRNFMSRRVYTYEEYIGLVMESGQDVNHDYSHGSTDEDPRMMAFFDSLVQRELEGWTSNTDLSDDQEDLEMQQMVSPEEEDTEEATQSSAVTSQSDDDNDPSTRGPGGQRHAGRSSREVRRAPQSSASANNSSRRSARDRKDDDEDEEEEEDEANKVSGASEWIMCMIAKKRAQLRAANARRKYFRKRHRKTTQKFLRSYTANRSRRRYLYHPESQRNSEESQVNGESHRLPNATLSNSSSSSIGMRRHSFRRYMAPYTIMVVDSDLESDDQDPNNDSDSDGQAQALSLSLPQSSVGTNGSNSKRKRHLWSPGSRSSSDETQRPEKRSHVELSNSDSELENGTSSSSHEDARRRSGRVVITSEIVDSNASESEVEISRRNGTAHPSVANGSGGGSDGTVDQSSVIPDVPSVDSVVSDLNFGVSNVSNGSVGQPESDLEVNCAVSQAIPISSISIDDSGSLSFDTDNNPVLPASLPVPNSVEEDSVTPSVSSNEDRTIQNGANQGGISHDASFSQENSEKRKLSAEVETNGLETSNGTDSSNNANSSKKVPFAFKKRVQYLNNVRNYRNHEEDL